VFYLRPELVQELLANAKESLLDRGQKKEKASLTTHNSDWRDGNVPTCVSCPSSEDNVTRDTAR
jgi:hypothetical protein